MSYINIAEWTPVHVVHWLLGLDDSIQPYVNFFLDNQVNGCRLLLLSSDDLDKLHIKKIGHQEIILDSVELLKHLHYNCTSENLQTLALKLGCKSRSLYNHLRKEKICGVCENCIINLQSPPPTQFSNENEESELYSNLFQPYKKSNVVIRKPASATSKRMCRKITTFTLSSVCDILNSVKQFITWIDRYSFEVQDYYSKIRQTILRISIELASTAQRDHFVENPKELIKNNCLKFAEICERIVQELNDSLCIQPACLELVPIRYKENEELGVKIFSSFRNVHVIGEIKMQSPVHRCGRIGEGDEIAQINYQTVLGWTQSKLIEAMKEYSTKILITIKKGPCHSRIAGQLKILEPSKIPHRESAILNKCKHDPNLMINRPSAAAAASFSQQQQQQQQRDQNREMQQQDAHISSTNAGNLTTTTISITNDDDDEKNQEPAAAAAAAATNTHKQLIEQISIEKPHKGPVYQISKENKPKRKELKRRATICGTSPHLTHHQRQLNAPPPICLEDLVNLNNDHNNDDVDDDDEDDVYAVDNLDIPDYTSVINTCKSFANLPSSSSGSTSPQTNMLLKQRKANPLSKRTLSSDADLKKRSISAYGYDRIYYDFTSSGKKPDFFNLNESNKEPNYCLIRSGDNNATVISINSSSNSSNNKILHVQSDDKEELIQLKSKSTSHNAVDAAESKEEDPPSLKEENKNLKINNNSNKEDDDKEEEEEEEEEEEVLKRRKSQAKLIKNLNLNCKQLRNNSDHQGFLNYLREELKNSNNNKSSPNNNTPKWKTNYFILKNELLYFYQNDDDNQEPSRIINLPIFSLDDRSLDYDSTNGLHVFKIASLKHAFHFGSTDLIELNGWIEKFQNIINVKNTTAAAANAFFATATRSVSCIDSSFLNKYSKIKQSMINQSIEDLSATTTTQQQQQQQFYLDQLNRQNHNNQVIEQNQNNHRKEAPKPQPRLSKIKQQNQQQQSDSNCVGKIISSFDELSKQCEKELDYYSSLRKKTVSNNNGGGVSNGSTKYVSVLDQEYNKLFKQSPPPPSLSSLNNNNNTIRTATSKEIQSIYLKQPQQPQQRCNSPITSDHSSSSGISSYVSSSLNNNPPNSNNINNNNTDKSDLKLDKNTSAVKSKEKSKKLVQRNSSFNSFRLFSSGRQVLSKLTSSSSSPPSSSSSSKETESFSSSSNKSSLTSSCSYSSPPRPKRSFFGLRKSSLPTQANNKSTSAAGKNNKTENHHLSRMKSKSSELLNNYIDHLSAEDFYLLQQEKFQRSNLNRPEFLTLNLRHTNNNSSHYHHHNSALPPSIPTTASTLLSNHHLNTPPETSRSVSKPCMGISLKLMNNRRRSSTVSCDRMAIEQAIQLHNEKLLMQNN